MSKIKVPLFKEELWPYFNITGSNTYNFDYEIYLTQAEIGHIDKVFSEFFKVQQMLEDMYFIADFNADNK